MCCETQPLHKALNFFVLKILLSISGNETSWLSKLNTFIFSKQKWSPVGTFSKENWAENVMSGKLLNFYGLVIKERF